jgi:DNA-binding MarR family transcriptional regulator
VKAGGSARTANLLGALALAVTDRCVQAAAEASGHSESDAAALSAIHQFAGGTSIALLASVIGLSQSGTVRVVNRLEQEGLIQRGPGRNGRVTSVLPTTAGERAARRLESTRIRLLDEALQPLAAAEQETLAALAGKLLVGMMREPGATRWTCRLCHLRACGRPSGHCPIEQAARTRYSDLTNPDLDRSAE